MEHLEYEMDPDEEQEQEQEMIPRDLRERRCYGLINNCSRDDDNPLMTIRVITRILPLTIFAVAAALIGISSCHRSGICSMNASQKTRSGSKRSLVQIHAGFDASEALGAKRSKVPFKDIDGTPKDPIAIFKDHGYTYSRLRVMVGPSGSDGLFQDLEYVKEMARDIVKQNSMKLLLDFHYSHWWADDENQLIPLEWIEDSGSHDDGNIKFSMLEEHVYNHTRAVMEELIKQETIPDAVQIGNEVNSGILWEHGRIVDGEMGSFVKLTNSATRAMKDSFSANNVESAFPQIVMHLASGGRADFTEQWFTNFTKAGGECDVIGLSYYPFWHRSLKDLSNNMKNIKSIFPNKSVWVVESAYYWTEPPRGVDHLPFDQSEDGQFDYLQSLLNVLKDYGHNTAVFYSGSHWTQPHLWINSNKTWGDESRSLFDQNAQVLKGIDALVANDY